MAEDTKPEAKPVAPKPSVPAMPPAATAPWWAVWGLGYTIVIALIALAGLIVWRAQDSSQYAQMVVTAMISLATGAVGYYFGSSSGSDKKDTAIANMSPGPGPNAAPDSQATADALNAAEALRNKLGAAQ